MVEWGATRPANGGKQKQKTSGSQVEEGWLGWDVSSGYFTCGEQNLLVEKEGRKEGTEQGGKCSRA